MFIISFLSGLLSTMNIWVDKISDVKLSLNDIYMSLLMTGWMFLFEGLYHLNKINMVFGAILVLLSFISIRKQLFIDQRQYMLGMIPHHSMAILMSQKLKKKGIVEDNDVNNLLNNIINSQKSEISFMKSYLK